MSHSSVSRVIMPKVSLPHSPKENDLEARLLRVINLLDKNDFPKLGFSVHYKIDEKPTIVLIGKYKSFQDKELFITLLNSKELKSILPENIVVEWMHGDEHSPNQTILENHPDYS